MTLDILGHVFCVRVFLHDWIVEDVDVFSMGLIVPTEFLSVGILYSLSLSLSLSL